MTERIRDIKFTTDRELIKFDTIADLYESVGFGAADFYKEDEEFEVAVFSPGSYGFFASLQDGRVVGMARVFSDNKICSWIAEICVHPDWRGEG